VHRTDDAALLEWAGFRVRVVPGEPSNFKITSPEDLARAEQVLLGVPSAGA
jgi:2-C-methyl-D-erythritol 4-phosphate cytidylyltransferase/2-C-methyl-D-erythritol 2,4-cyclodiphosphate synthase